MKAGFTGGLVVDFPNSAKAKKVFLVLFTGGTNQTLPRGLTGADEVGQREEEGMKCFQDRQALKGKKLRSKPAKKTRDWILMKKERQRCKGITMDKSIRPDSKYTGRKRSGRFWLVKFSVFV